MEIGKNLFKLYLIVTAISSLTQKAYANSDNPIISILDGSKNQIAKDSAVNAKDSLFFSSTFASNLVKPYPVKDVITFHINELSHVVLPSTFTAIVHLKINYTNANNQKDSLNDLRLVLNYNSSATYISRASFVFSGAYQVKITVLNDTISSSVISALMIDNEIIPSRVYTFGCTGKDITQVNLVGATADELTVSWNNVTGADQTDLEWTYIDSSALANGMYSVNGNYDPSLVFVNNSTRVSITDLSYAIPLIFPGSGSVFIRVRAVHFSNGNRIVSNWSSNYSPNGMLKYDFTGHERKLNWQSSISFAEDSKRKVVVEYYDGSLRNHETVTKDNSNNTTITAETFYDYQGRPAIKVLPSPSIITAIQYTKNFNRINGAEYDKSYFDSVIYPNTSCTLQTPSMDSNYGAAQYYSANNPVITGIHKFIPEAFGYAFTQTEYTQDNTGRISRQGGVGQEFQLNSGHETKYYYSITPDQNELDALFGTEAGDHTHYFKNAVRDANGQYSISYVDMHGRTIATALAGNTPSSVTALNSNIPSVITQTLADASTNITDGLSMISHKSILIEKAGNQHFQYSLNPQTFQLNNCSASAICYDCLYNLTITITDDCGNQKLGGHPLTFIKSNVTVTDASCNANSIVLDTTIFLDEGNYEIIKTLSVDAASQNNYRDNVYTPNNICKTTSDFINFQKQVLPHGNCNLTCASCRASIGSYANFTTDYMIKVYGDTSGTATHQSEILAAYNNALGSCDAYCDDTVTAQTDYVRQAMLLDVSPKSGQYANLDSAQDIYSIFYTNHGSKTPTYQKISWYPNEQGRPDSVWNNVTGKKVPPQQLDFYQFAENFKPSWADSLLPHHPEYCKLQAYQSLYSSYNWDKKFQAISTYSEAISKGFANPIATGANKDPLASNSNFQSSLSTKYSQYLTTTMNSQTVTLTMWQMAILLTKCPSGDSNCLRNIVFASSPDYSLTCSGDSNTAWHNFQQLYISYKSELLNQYYNNLTCTIDGNTITSQNLFDDHHSLNFNTTTSILSANGLGFTSSTNSQVIKDSGQAQMRRFYQSNCQSYDSLWAQQLSAGYQPSQITTLLPLLNQVCVAGSDQYHPFGSRTINPNNPALSVTINAQQRFVSSFDDIINTYNSTYQPIPLLTTISRNADVLTVPTPYDAQPAYTKTIITAPTSDQCSQIFYYHSLYTMYHNRSINETFSQYLKRTKNTDISDEDLQILMNACSATSSCNYFVHPINLPPIFQTGIGNTCIGCGEFNNLYAEYKELYGDSSSPASANQTNSLQQQKNQLFTNFMNNRLGYNLLFIDYFNFMSQCNQFNGASGGNFKAGSVVQLTCNNWAKLTGLNPGVDIGNLNVTGNNITVEGLFNSQWLAADGGDIISKHTTVSDCNYFLRPYGGFIATTTGFHVANIFTPCDVDSNRTYHVALVYDGHYLKFYRDGYLLAQDTCTGNLITNNWSARIGQEHFANNGNDFKGYINEVRIWNSARTQDQIRQYMFSSLPNPTTQTGLLAYYVFDNLQNKQGNSTYNGTFLNSQSTLNATNPECLFYVDSCPVTISGPTLCGKLQPAYPLAKLDTITSCTDSTFYAVSTGTEMYKSYLDSAKNSFDSIYHIKCLNAYNYETFTVTDTVDEYQYTLYYYDQAGNLVQTIPPQAVNANWNSTYLAQVKTKRVTGDTLRPGHNLLLATQYRYNTLNQVVSQKTPDAGISNFYYDRLGRLVLSKNAKQTLTSKYSYTNYDGLGRITEVGELTNASSMNATVSKIPSQLQSWLTAANTSRTQITQTTYDTVYFGIDGVVLNAKNLRNRVSYSQYFALASDQSNAHPKAGTYYSYDIAGNVDTLLQDYTIPSLPTNSNRFFKKIVYQYDLISGKVNLVAYNPGSPEAFYHHYIYDAENRITNVETSTDSIYWENESFYRYYLHGPLARSGLGEQQVQAIDYAYTLQGWLKGINTTNANTSFDMGGDGFTSNRVDVARDVFGFALHYFSTDYKPISNTSTPFAAMNTTVLSSFKPLYNGNIAAMSENLTSFSKPLLFTYGYDQLNRLIQMRAYKNSSTGFSSSNNFWAPTPVPDYSEDVSYDPNGNILKYKRYGNSTNGTLSNALLMDSLNYKYIANSNKLDWIKDSVPSGTFTVDIDNQAQKNYRYDSIGNMVSDSTGGIDSIAWNVYGKIQKINKHDGTIINYYYDASGSRIGKVVTGAASGNGETWYVHDASGNVMSVYNVNDNNINSGALTLSEQGLCGSSRLGLYKPNLNLTSYTAPTLISMNSLGSVGYNNIFWRGQKFYELTNHLGNVLVTISDKKSGVDNTNDGVIDYYLSDIVSASDYYPGGMQMPGRTFTSSTSSSYRYGFNGKEKDPNITSEDYDYGFRIYDARVVRFLSIDPLTREYPELTPYQFASNRPIDGTDRDGLEWELSTVKHNLQFNNTTQQQIPSSQELKMQVLRQEMMAAAKRPQPQLQPAPVYTPEEQQRHDAITARNLDNAGYNADGTPKPLTRLAENKTWNNFANNVALPMATMAAGDGLFKLGGKAVTYLTADAINSATTAQIGEIVLGKYPDYVNLASLKNTKVFNIPMKYWTKMTADEQLAANLKFLDRAITRGDNIVLSNKVTDISKVTGAFRTELDYLVKKGYNVSSDGFQMVKK